MQDVRLYEKIGVSASIVISLLVKVFAILMSSH